MSITTVVNLHYIEWYFNHCESIPDTIEPKEYPAERWVDVPYLIKTHIITLKANSGNLAYISYFDRLKVIYKYTLEMNGSKELSK